jgi:hypothetical protein
MIALFLVSSLSDIQKISVTLSLVLVNISDIL